MPKRKSRNLKVLQNTIRKENDTGADPYPPKIFPKNPPKSLPTKGKFLWRNLVSPMYEAGVLKNIDRFGFEELCRCYGFMRELEDQIQEEGWTVPGRQNSVKKNPLFTQLKFYREQFLKLGKQYGLFPYSRQSIDFTEVDHSADDIERFLSGV